MAKFSALAGATSQSDVIFIQDSSSTTGAGLSGLAFNTSGLTAYYSFAGANATATAITLATLAAVNSAWSSGGFKEIDATNMKGWYRFDIPNAALATSKGRIVGVHFQGATNMAPCAVAYELTGWDNQDAVHGGLTCLPNTAVTTNASLLTSGTGTDQLSVTTGRVDLGKTLGTTSTGAAGSVGIDWSQVANKTSTVALTNTTVGTVTTVTNQLTAAAVATGVWQDTTAGDFTTALSVGKSIMNGVALGTGLRIALADTVTTLTNLPSIPANWLTAAGINAGALNGKGDWMVSYTQPTGFLAATFPSGTVANTTNITAGTITTATNLTNAATSGDLTATMAATVKTQAVAALNTDTYAEPAQGTPAATTTLVGKIGFLYKAWRNKTTQDSTTYKLFNDDTATVDHKAAVSDDGTTFTKGEVATGP